MSISLTRRSITDFLLFNLFLFVSALALPGCNTASQSRQVSITAQVSPSPTPTLENAQDQSDAINRPTSNPYTGELSIFEDPKRVEKLQPSRIMDILGIKEGSTVADIGAGSGWFTVRSKRENLANIRVILGKDDDPLLPEKSIDAVLLLKTYHEVAQPIRLLKRTRAAMRAAALLGIIDRNGKGDDHGLDKEVVIKEAARAGFVLVNQYDFVKPDNVDYFLVFRASPYP